VQHLTRYELYSLLAEAKRHSEREAGIENVRQHLGHRSLSSTGSYLRVSDEAASGAVFKAAA
jgi:hypothetical protein